MVWLTKIWTVVSKNLFSVLVLLFIHLGVSYAEELYRPVTVTDLLGLKTPFGDPDIPTIEAARRIEGQSIVRWKNPEAIKRDFPQTQNLNDAQLDKWILENANLIGSQQTRLNGIRNSNINTSVSDRVLIRPEEWVRSAIIEITHPNFSDLVIGLMDLKGVGHGAQTRLGRNATREVGKQVTAFLKANGSLDELNQIRVKDHSDGLMTLGEALAEVKRQQLVQLLFDYLGLPHETVESYAIIEPPFRLLKQNNETSPVGMVLRQVNMGRLHGLPVPTEIYTDVYGGRQATLFHTSVDFGGVVIHHPLAGYWAESAQSPIIDPQHSKIWSAAHDAANKVQGDVESTAITDFLNDDALRNLQQLCVKSEACQKKLEQRRQKRANIKARRNNTTNFQDFYDQFKREFVSMRPKLVQELLADIELVKEKRTLGYLMNTLYGVTDQRLIPYWKKLIMETELDYFAAFALKKFTDPQALIEIDKIIQELWKHGNPDKKDLVFELLLDRQDKSSLALIEEIMKDPAFTWRGSYLLEARTDLDSLAFIEKIMKTQSQNSYVVMNLSERKDPAAWKLVKSALLSDDLMRKHAGARALIRHKNPEVLSLIESIFEYKIAHHADQFTFEHAAAALEGHTEPEVMSKVIKLFKLAMGNKYIHVRRAAAAALRGQSNEGLIPIIEKALESEDRLTRRLALRALRGFDSARARALIEDNLTKTRMQMPTLFALSGRDDPWSLKILEQVIDSESYSRNVRRFAARILARRTDDQSIPILRRILKGHDSVLKRDAAWTFLNRTDTAFHPLRSESLNLIVGNTAQFWVHAQERSRNSANKCSMIFQ